MKKTSRAIILLLSLASMSNASDPTTIAEAFKNGKWEGRVRFQYFFTDWDDNSVVTGKGADDGKGTAMGGSINYKTAPFYGLSIGTGLYTTQNFFNLTDPEDGAGATTSK
ncbi:MAG: hypothetical protein IE880_06215, partial [Epsilonproteobacteria bacterium]|nr:hypothetical protein [Campylobacterota bacterium]